MLKSVLITGANSGLGKECARQLALQDGVEKIYLGCRNQERAQAAKLELEQSTGRAVFDIVLMDVSNLESVRSAVESFKEPVDGLVMNAGGSGGKEFKDRTEYGVMRTFAVNLLGHVVLAEELLKAQKLTTVAVYAGSEAARGIEGMGTKRPELKTSSVDEFASICDGSFFGNVNDSVVAYGPIKYMAALWMSSISRQYPDIRFVTMSPGGTAGTNAFGALSPVQKLIYGAMFKFMSWSGKVHKLEVGARRFVDALLDESYKSGIFYASKTGVTGEVVDQATIFPDLNNQEFQDNANKAIHRFIH